MLAGREDHMTKLGKTKPISVEKHSMSMVVLKKYKWSGVKKHHLRGVLKTNTSKRPKLT